MTDASYFVYALKDPQTDTPFYVGRQTGSRSYDHLVQADDSPKGRRIREIVAAGGTVQIALLVEDVSEAEAIRAVAMLIAEHGLASRGGPLLNPEVRRGASARLDRLRMPPGIERELTGRLSGLLDTVMTLARANPDGIGDADLVARLDDGRYPPGHYASLAHCLLDLLVRDGSLSRDPANHRYAPAHKEGEGDPG
jgi:hypothetical protein